MKYRLSVSLVFATLLLLVFSQTSFSHPHAFIDNRLTMVFDNDGFAGIRVEWVFDEFFSSMIACDYDTNKNNILENSEITAIGKGAFDNLVNFDYFTVIRVGGKPFKIKYVRDFSAALKEGNLIYDFFIPCHVKAIPAFKEIVISQYDPTYYTDMSLDEDQLIMVEGNSGIETSCRISENPKISYYFGLVHPIEVVVVERTLNIAAALIVTILGLTLLAATV
ncbi:MAG: DUF1007 family protein [Syntrophobacterales bacterium]|nr:DUF1007 family protein [Syntrophobacterales bacterium]